MLDSQILDRVENFLRRKECSLVLVVGTTATFHYIIDWALRAKNSGGMLVEINPEETELSAAADITHRKRAAEIFPGMLAL